ncbi:MAG: sel1 repeat family protein [Kiritimatiellae bacterium]|nr:sel1 repeat family protein [Kiritimatiellia bacterium]
MTDVEYFTALKRGAAKGDVIAAWNLADAYAEGYVLRENGAWFSVRRNRALAERLYRFVAKTRMRDVVLSLASVQNNINDTLRLERKAWRMGVTDAANNIAMTYSIMGRPDLCFTWLKRGYAINPEGHAYNLALCYLVGYGVTRHLKTARRLLNQVVRKRWECPDSLECAAQFLKMMEKGTIPKPPRQGQSIGSIRPINVSSPT